MTQALSDWEPRPCLRNFSDDEFMLLLALEDASSVPIETSDLLSELRVLWAMPERDFDTLCSHLLASNWQQPQNHSLIRIQAKCRGLYTLVANASLRA